MRKYQRARAATAAAVAATSLALAAPTVGAQGPVEDPRPNILIILTDDQRFDMLQRKVVPNIRRLYGDQGVRFRNGVVTTPLCCPSRVSIFSGRYVHNHGVDDNSPGDDNWDESATMQRVLDEAGYTTAIAGKYLSNWKGQLSHFDRFAVQTRPAPRDNAYYNASFNVDGEISQIPIHSTDFTRFKAMDFLEDFEENDESPWFLQVSPLSPHRPWTPLDQHLDEEVPRWNKPPSVREKVNDKPRYVRRSREVTDWWANTVRKRMLRSMMGVDGLVRDIFVSLEALGENDNTLAFFMSDNGYMLGEHGLYMRKQVPYAESIRVPFFMRWPAQIPKRRVSTRIAANIDIAPTVYEAVGIPPEEVGYVVDGRSLLGDFRRDHILIESPLVTEDTPGWEGLWSPRWQYVRYSTGEREYYETAKDPFQQTNLLGNRPSSDDPETDELDLIIDSAKLCAGSTCP